MKYRVQVDIAFENEDDALAVMNFIESVKTKTAQPTGKETIELQRVCRYHACLHDDKEPKPCGDYIFVDFSASATTHKTKLSKGAQ